MESEITADKRSLGQSQIETAIGVMLNARGLRLDAPIRWLKHAEFDAYTIEASIRGQLCIWILVGGAVDDYAGDLSVRYSVDSNLASHFLPR